MTKYYVRNMYCGEFLASDYTRNEFLYVDGSGTYISTANDMMPITENQGVDKYFRLFTICEDTAIQKTPRNRTTDIHLKKLTQLGLPAPETGTGVSIAHSAGNFLGLWENYNWSNPDSAYSTWVNELCNFFEAAKVTDASIYGSDSGHINLYIITWIDSGTKRYLPLFKMGNDSNYDTLIEI